MSENKELSLEELEKAAGGEFDDECHGWFNRNSYLITLRASEKGVRLKSAVLTVQLKNSDDIVTVDIFKQKLKEIGVDCDDLM